MTCETGFLPPTWVTWIKFLPPSLAWPSPDFVNTGGINQQVRDSYSLSLSLCFSSKIKKSLFLTWTCISTIWPKYLFSRTPSENSLLVCRFEYMCPQKQHSNIPKPYISELICDAGISPAGTFYCCECFALFLVIIYLARRLRSFVGITKWLMSWGVQLSS